MRIACDARPLLGPRTGVGTWLEGLLRALAGEPLWEWSLELPRRADLGLGLPPARFRTHAPPLSLPGTLWLATLAGPALAGRADVYVGTLGVLPRRLPVPAALVVHDLTPRTRPHHHTLANRFCFNAYLDDSLGRADAVVCVSRATRERLAAVSPQAARRATVIGEGVDDRFSPAPPEASPEPWRVRFAAGRPYFVQVGTLEPRKGVATLLEAHHRLLTRRPDAPDLVLAGRRGWGGDLVGRALARHARPDRVHLPGYVEHEAVVGLLRHAEAAVFASEEEGYGRPLAEALACGAACVASDEPALVETAAGAGLHVPRGDAGALSAALEAVTAPAAAARLRDLARRRRRELGWAPVAAAWRELFGSLAG